jgi:hypothetical protein
VAGYGWLAAIAGGGSNWLLRQVFNPSVCVHDKSTAPVSCCPGRGSHKVDSLTPQRLRCNLWITRPMLATETGAIRQWKIIGAVIVIADAFQPNWLAFALRGNFYSPYA